MSGAPATEYTTYYLQMSGKPDSEAVPPPRGGLSIVHAVAPSVRWYRFLYESVGGPWQWTDRSKLSDAALAAIVADPAVAVHVLYVDGVPVGYAEIDARPNAQPPGWPEGSVELAYFGIFPERIGQKLGPYLLSWAIRRAWEVHPALRRLWVHTCTLDHPAALAMYQRFGFGIYDVERHTLESDGS